MSEGEIKQRRDALLMRRVDVQNKIPRVIKTRRLFSVRSKSEVPFIQPTK